MGLMEKLRFHSEQHFGPGSKLNKTILRKILEVYTDDKGKELDKFLIENLRACRSQASCVII